MKAHRCRLAVVLLAVALAAGCGKGEGNKAATQVAAKVGSHEITVHQINAVLAASPNIAPERAAQARRQILDRLVDQEIAKQQAIEKKLHRTPSVVQTIESAKDEILARSYFEQIAAAQPKPSVEETKRYYAEHPELFAQRRVFNLEEIVAVPKEGLVASLREQVARARSMQDIAAWLKSQGAEIAENRGVRAAEQIPLESLVGLQAMKDGETRVFEAGGRLHVFRVAASQAAPVDEATATPRIQQFLFNQRSSETIAKEMTQIKEKTKIEYLGEFAGAAAATTADKPAAATTATKPAAATTAAPPAAAPPQGPDFAKGVRGLR